MRAYLLGHGRTDIFQLQSIFLGQNGFLAFLEGLEGPFDRQGVVLPGIRVRGGLYQQLLQPIQSCLVGKMLCLDLVNRYGLAGRIVGGQLYSSLC